LILLFLARFLDNPLTRATIDPSGALFSGLLSPDLIIVDEGTNIKNTEVRPANSVLVPF
jgi:hypothetical protein